MRLMSLHIDQLPGIDGPLGVVDLVPGVNVIVGPNASGKSSLLRALLALLYPSEHEGGIGAQARFLSSSGTELLARRLGQDVTWERGGRHTQAPALPAYHLVGAYTLRLEDWSPPTMPRREARFRSTPDTPGTPGLAAAPNSTGHRRRDREATNGGIDMGRSVALWQPSEAGRKWRGREVRGKNLKSSSSSELHSGSAKPSCRGCARSRGRACACQDEP